MFMKNLMIPAAVAMLAFGPAYAGGKSEHAGERGDFVAEAKADRQDESGPSGWGQRVADRANGSMENPYGNLGGYLREKSEGPSGGN